VPTREWRLDWPLRGVLFVLNGRSTLRVVWLMVSRVMPRVMDVWSLLALYIVFTGACA
jgi:hypothetical protein